MRASELDHKMHRPETRPEPKTEHDGKEPHEFQVRRLHDGTYHHQRTYLSDHPTVEGFGDLDSVHDA
jgi:hypothetical protein